MSKRKWANLDLRRPWRSRCVLWARQRPVDAPRGVARWRRAWSVAIAVVSASSFSPVRAKGVAPPGPPLESDSVAMETALGCPDGISSDPVRPLVLLVQGTSSTAAEDFGFGLVHVLRQAGIDWCVVELPARATVDIQISAEYVVHAVRALHDRTARKVSLMGVSQGALEVRWAVRWWPDVRAAVDDVVSFVGPNRGSVSANLVLCGKGECIPPEWQWSRGSAFIEALNRVSAPEGPSYTAIYSQTDWVIQPSWPESQAAGAIDGATNIVVQDICPGRVVDHVQSLFDAVFAAAFVDALKHPGPADPARIDRAVCSQVFAPPIDPVMATVAITTIYANAFATTNAAPKTRREPPLRPFSRHG